MNLIYVSGITVVGVILGVALRMYKSSLQYQVDSLRKRLKKAGFMYDIILLKNTNDLYTIRIIDTSDGSNEKQNELTKSILKYVEDNVEEVSVSYVRSGELSE